MSCPRKYTPWSAEDVATLWEHHDLTEGPLARLMGRTVGSISGARYIYGREPGMNAKRVIAGNSVRGQLMTTGFENSYVGWRPARNGKRETRKFTGSHVAAVSDFEKWIDELQREQVATEATANTDKEEPKVTATTMPKAEPPKEAQDKGSDGLYVLQVVGGPALYAFDDFDRAAMVSDALTAAAKASGFAAQYDVMEVKRWQ